MYFNRTPLIIRKSFPKIIWNIPTKKKEIYLTFDDGPIPEITPWVLNELKKYNAKATFFCVGENIEKHSQIFQQIISEGHSIGNHTFHHLNGWKVKNEKYFEDIENCQNIIEEKLQIAELVCPLTDCKLQIGLFRPPYGKIRPSQYSIINQQYSIVLWDVLSGDFDKKISKEKCLKNVLNNYKNGSIIVFHDSIKASVKLNFVLPKLLEYFSEKGFEFKAIKKLSPELTRDRKPPTMKI